jgi:hypothetical protein
MRTRTPLLALLAGLTLALAPAADAATPFTAGTGNGHDLAVGSNGMGHVVWNTDEANDRVGYCRIPNGGSACDSESTFLSFPGATTASTAGDHAQILTPATNKVVILASCNACGLSGGDRSYRWISNNSGADWGPAVEVGTLELNGEAGYFNSLDIGLSVSGRLFQGQDDGPSTTERQLGSTPSSVYDSSALQVPFASAVKAVYAVNDLDAVEYRVFNDPIAPVSATDLNSAGNWSVAKFLTAAEGNNDETHLSSGPTWAYLTYRYNQPTGNRLGLRRFDPATDTFGGATYIEGDDPIESSSLAESFHSQDASGRLHVVWRTLYDGNRLRYRRSDMSGGNFSAAQNLATRETFLSPKVEAAPDGNGFAAWRSSGNAIRVVPIDPQPEPGGGGPGPGGGPDSTPPTVGSPIIGDPTLTPGQGTTFTFTSSEAGMATLTVQKQVKGMKVKVRGKRKCVPQTRKRLRALRRRAGSAAAFRRALRRARCKAYKKIGSIKQAVVPGQNTIVFNGRIAGRKLRPGRYRALLVIQDSAGNVSRVERVRFRVLRRRR